MLPLLGVFAIIYGVFSLIFTLFSAPGGESPYAMTERLGVEVPGRIERIQTQTGNRYAVEVTFATLVGRRYRQLMTIYGWQENLTVPSDVTVIYLPQHPYDAFIKGLSDPQRDNGELFTNILRSLAFIGGGALFLYIFGGWLSSYGRSESVDTH